MSRLLFKLLSCNISTYHLQKSLMYRSKVTSHALNYAFNILTFSYVM